MKQVKAVVKAITEGSPAAESGLKAGDALLGVDGFSMLDIIDWRLLTSDYAFTLNVLREGRQLDVRVVRNGIADLGIEFSDILFDGIRECANKCIFCFVDQLPEGSRESLCVKDDDYRLSFLQGNFVTLTNCSQRTLERIVDLRMSPIYISVHSTDPALRNRLLGRVATKPIMDVLRYLGANGIEVHTQIVLVPGVNDSEDLEKSLADLCGLYPAVRSIGIVPVGLTRHRQNSASLRAVSEGDAISALEAVERFQGSCFERHGTRLVWAADELYLRANKPFPAGETYESYVQLENGIGLARLMYDDFEAELRERTWKPERDPSADLLVTGVDGARVIAPLLEQLRERFGKAPSVLAVENDYFGRSVTVTGLLVGRDIIDALKSCIAEKGGIRRILLPDIVLRRGDDVLLDSKKLSDIVKAVNTSVEKVSTSAEGLLRAAGLAPEGGSR